VVKIAIPLDWGKIWILLSPREAREVAMRFRKTLTLLILALGLAFALPAWAQQKPVAPGLSPAPADVAASLPRHGGVKPPLRYAALKGGATTATSTPAKPFTQEQVVSMVRDGFGDESGAKLIEQRGIDFAPSEDFLQTLKAAGASEAFLKALRAAKPPVPASAKKPLNQVQVFALLVGQVPSHRVTMLVQERGIDFEPTDEYLQEVRLAGGEDELISALKSAKVTKPATVDPAAQAHQVDVRQHVARGGEFVQKRQYAQAEQEYRAALLLDSQNADVYVSLAYVLGQQNKWDDAVSAAREAVRLDPNYDGAHNNLGDALYRKGDMDGAIAEFREALRLNPNLEVAHYSLGVALGRKGDWDGGIAEEREALRLNPNDDLAHTSLGAGLGYKRDWNGEMAEEREALRLNPNNDVAHCNLGAALANKRNWDGAIVEEREALRLNPNDDSAHYFLGVALERKRRFQEALQEYRTAYELNPQDPNFRKDYERLAKKTRP
jgi:tetratricopeptide (TPR) repeat protein